MQTLSELTPEIMLTTTPETDDRPPHVTPEEATFLYERGPYVGRFEATKTLLRFALDHEDEVSPEFIEDLREQQVQRRMEMIRFGRKDPRPKPKPLATVVTITNAPKQASRTLREELSWQDDGACQNKGQDKFYPERGASNGRALTIAAKKVCETCIVRPDCLRYAIKNNEKHGIWGGLTRKERTQLKNKINAQRQQKTA